MRKQKEIALTCVDAIYDAQKIYYKMSDGDWLLHAPEYFLTTMIALALKDRVTNIYVTLENSTSDALEEAEAINPSKSKKIHEDIRAKGKVDILVWDKVQPVGLIEVKNNCWANTEINKDLKRIEKILELNHEEDGSIEFGIFTYYYSLFGGTKKNSKTKYKSRKRKLEELTGKIFDEKYTKEFVHRKPKVDKDGDLWGAFSILLYREKKAT